VTFCTHCGVDLQDSHRYCWNCGTRAEPSEQVPVKPGFLSHFFATRFRDPGQRTFSRRFGLDPRIAVLTLIVDMMLNAGDLFTMGLLLPISVAAGIVLGFIAYKAQIYWYGDDKESAKIKAIMLGLLTAIPTPLPEVLYIPAGLLGLVHTLRRKESRT